MDNSLVPGDEPDDPKAQPLVVEAEVVAETVASQARRRMRTESGGYRRDHLRALAQRVEVDAKEVRIMGSKSVLLSTLVAASSAKSATFGVPSSVGKWRARRDSNSRPSDSKSDALSS